MPFFCPQSLRAFIPKDALLFRTSELRQMAMGVGWRDLYATYGMQTEVEYVVLLDAQSFRALPHDVQQLLLHTQFRLGRGHIHRWDVVETWLTPLERKLATPLRFVVSGVEYVTPDRVLWDQLSDQTRWKWLASYVGESGVDCLSSTLSAAAWWRIEKQHGPMPRQLAGNFAWSSGPNCFATTLAALSRSEVHAASLASIWLHQTPFLRGLEQQGYTLHPDCESAAAPPGAVIGWEDAHGTLQHACFVVDHDLILNKNAQGWHAPRQLLARATVFEIWNEEHLTPRVYMRDERTESFP